MKRAKVMCVFSSFVALLFGIVSVLAKPFEVYEYCFVILVLHDDYVYFSGAVVVIYTSAILIVYRKTMYVICKTKRGKGDMIPLRVSKMTLLLM